MINIEYHCVQLELSWTAIGASIVVIHGHIVPVLALKSPAAALPDQVLFTREPMSFGGETPEVKPG